MQKVGLEPLFGALEAAANCPGLVIDAPRFGAAMTAYGLSDRDLTPIGRYALRIRELTAADRARILDDRQAFCSAAALQFAIEPSLLRVAP